MTENIMRLVRLFHLVSPSLPTGAFAYSQGIEWSVENGWISCAEELEYWLADVMNHSVSMVDIALFCRLYEACTEKNLQQFRHWSDTLLACRETKELRDEEVNRGRALASLLNTFSMDVDREWQKTIEGCQLAGFAFVAAHWQIDKRQAASGYVWAWLENQVLAGVKIIPLGQSQGQQILYRLGQNIEETVSSGFACHDQEIGAGLPAFAISSSRHELQYTRLYRS